MSQKKNHRKGCGYYRTITLRGACKVLLICVTRCLREYREGEGLRPKEEYGFRPQWSTIDMMFVVRRLHELARAWKILPQRSFVDLQSHVSVDRSFLWTVLARCSAFRDDFG